MEVALIVIATLFLIVVVGVCVCMGMKTKGERKESFEPPKMVGEHRPVKLNINTDEVATGVQRALWGSLMPIQKKDDRYLTMRNTPWCLPNFQAFPECSVRTMEAGQCREEIPNELNKI